jgi:hypothetical protein
MKTQVKLVSPANKSSEAKTVKKVAKAPKVSKSILAKQVKAKAFVKKDANSFKKLLQVSRLTLLESMGLNRALKTYLVTADKVLTDSQMSHLTFAKVKAHINGSKYKALPLFSLHQITLICNEVLKANDKNTARAVKVKRQNEAIAKK